MHLEYFLFVLITQTDSVVHFNYDARESLYPDDEYMDKNSLFGYKVHFSQKNRAFYVSAINALNDNPNGQTEVGAIYKCTMDDSQICTKFITPDSSDDISDEFPVRSLFGFSLIETSQGILVICSPNIVYSTTSDGFCTQYDQLTGESLAFQDFPLKRSNESITYVDNYGIQMELNDPTTEPDPKFLVGQYNFIYNRFEDQPSEFTNFLVSTSSNGVIQDVPVSNIPANQFIVNPNDELNYLVVPYSYSNRLRGSFDVFTRALVIHQHIDLSVGTAGQQFGYSSTFGKFSLNSCNEIILTAPFYTIKGDEGVAYLFKCWDITHKFDENPILLEGDRSPFARFGIAVVNLRDINYDGFEDVAFLASNWYTSVAAVYIYTTDLYNGFTGAYSQRIELIEADDIELGNVFAHSLYARFDVNGDGVNELAVSYPSENRVIYMMGVRFTKFETTITYSAKNTIPTLISTGDGDGSVGNYYYNISLHICYRLLYLTYLELQQKIKVDYRVAITGYNENFFYIDNTLVSEIASSVDVTSIGNQLCLNETLLYLYYPTPVHDYIEFQVQAKAKVDATTCAGYCIQPEDYSLSFVLFPNILPCDNSDCLPKFDQRVEISQSPLDLSIVNRRKINITLTNTGILVTQFPTASFTTCAEVSVISAIFDGVTEIDTLEGKATTTDGISRYYTAVKGLMPGESLTLRLEIEVIINIDKNSTNFTFVSQDATTNNSQTPPITVEIQNIKSLDFMMATSIPEELYVFSVNSTVATISEDLKYFVEVMNTLLNTPMSDLYLKVTLPLFVEEVEIFAIKSLEYTDNIGMVDCNASVQSECSHDTISFVANSLLPGSVASIEFTLTSTLGCQVLIDKKINQLQLIAELEAIITGQKWKTVDNATTRIEIQAETSTEDMIGGVSVAIICALVLFGILIFVLYKIKATKSVKHMVLK